MKLLMPHKCNSKEEFHAVISDEPWSSQRTRLKTHFDQVTTTGQDTLESAAVKGKQSERIALRRDKTHIEYELRLKHRFIDKSVPNESHQ